MNEKNKEYLSNAEIAFSNSQYDTAFEWYEKAIAVDPLDAVSYSNAGKTCIILNKLDKAEQYFQKAVELEKDNGDKYFDLGNIKFGLEKYNEALENYAKAEQLGCRDEIKQKLYYQIGMINHMSGDTKSALLNFEKSERMNTTVNADTKEIFLKRLQIYIEAEDYRNAENYAIQLKMLAPDEFRSYQIYFQILVAVGKYDKAGEVLNEAESYVDIDSDIQNRIDVYFDKAMLCVVKADKEPENAKQYFESALKLFDELQTGYDLSQEVLVNVVFSKAEIYLKLEQFDAALDCINRIDYNDEIEEKVKFIKLSCYLGKEEYEKADKYAEQLKQSNTEYYVYFATYADAFIAKKLSAKNVIQVRIAELKYNNAVAYFKNKSFENPQDIFALIFRVRLYAENGKFTRAGELIKLLPDILKNELQKYIIDCQNALGKR